MSRRKLRVAIVQIEGTNNDGELAVALKALGASPEIVHLKQLEHRDVERDHFRSLDEFGMVMFPGGFSAGDHVRAGAIFAARVRAAIGDQLEEYVRSGRLVGGLCNGFQVLIELGLLPGHSGSRLGPPEAALMANDSGRYECRPTFLRWEGGRFTPMSKIPSGELFLFPSGHAEGKFVLSGAPGARLPELAENGQILFRWSKPDGSKATYPWNPNGSEDDVAGLTSPDGNVFGLMPHPERHFFRVQNPEWTRSGTSEGFGDGHRFLHTLVEFAQSAG